MIRIIRAAVYARAADGSLAELDVEVRRLAGLLTAWAPSDRGASLILHLEPFEDGHGRPGPVLQRLLVDAKQGRYTLLLVSDLAQLGATADRRQAVLEALGAAGVEVRTEGMLARLAREAA